MSTTIEDTKYTIETIGNNNKFILSDQLRSEADQVLATTDFPTTRTEAWKYTRVAKIKNTSFKTQSVTSGKINIQDFLVPGISGSVLVFINGFYSKENSIIETESGIEIVALSESKSFSDKLGSIIPVNNSIFTALNTYYAQDGVGIKVAKKAPIKQHIQIVSITSGENRYAGIRNIILCEDSSSVHLTFNHVSIKASSCFSNVISEIHVGENAQLTINKIQQESNSNYSINYESVVQEKNSTFSINTITLNGSLVRNDLNIEVKGENCETHLNGAYILKDKQHIDNHTVVDHKVAHCQSNELYKGVIDGQATAVFNGKVFVRKDAQKINAFQSNGNILLSDNATVNSKPELEIYADDVKCSHGSTTGQLDEEAVFYLRTRGISEKSARALMVSAFIGDVLEKVANKNVQSYIENQIEQQFGWAK